jgi:DNA-binding transcriptional MerR regulator
MAKSRDAFRTISEVSEWLDTPAHVLRFWESRFTQIKPIKRAGGRRYYRPSDMELLGGIKRLLHDDGITIKGVQKILREKGVKYVASLSLEAVGAPSEAAEAPELGTETTPIDAILSDAPEADAAAGDDGGSGDSGSAGDDAPSRPSHAEMAAYFAREIENIRTSDDDDDGETPADAVVIADAEDDAETDDDTFAADAEDAAESEPRQAFVAPRRPSEDSESADTAIRFHAFGGRGEAPDDMGVAEIDQDQRSARIVALYRRLESLRDRVRADMQRG